MKKSILEVTGFAAVLIGIFLFTLFIEGTWNGQVFAAETKQFSVLDYNRALTHYDKGEYALAYNVLLDSNAPVEAYKAFGWSK